MKYGLLAGDLALDCGQISPQEAAELDRNRAAAKSQNPSSPPGNSPGGSGDPGDSRRGPPSAPNPAGGPPGTSPPNP